MNWVGLGWIELGWVGLSQNVEGKSGENVRSKNAVQRRNSEEVGSAHICVRVRVRVQDLYIERNEVLYSDKAATCSDFS